MKRTLLYLGLSAQAAAVLAFSFTLYYINLALNSADEAVNGDLESVSFYLSKSYSATLIGAPIGAIGLLIFFLAAKKIEKKERWMRNMGIAISLPYLLLFPLGTILGGLSLFYFGKNKNEFENEV